MSYSDLTKKNTREEWRELGFYYKLDVQKNEWHFIGSKTGLEIFRDILFKYADTIENDHKSEHQHYGPYMYLEIMTWDSPGVDKHSIHGSLQDLKHLGCLIDNKLKHALPNSSFSIREEYSKDSSCSMIFEVKEDNFDPANADPKLLE